MVFFKCTTKQCLRFLLACLLMMSSTIATAQSTYTTTQDNRQGKELEEVENQFVFEGTEKLYSGPIFKNWTRGDIPCERGIVDKGFRHGDWKLYHMGGPLKAEGVYDKGNPIGKWESFYLSGKVESKFSYDNTGVQQGEKIIYYESGKIKEKKNYVDGYLEGTVETFYSDGKKHEVKFYIHSKKNGQFLTYYADGNLDTEENYVDDRKEGKFIETFKTGETRRIGNYINGRRVGESKTFHQNGALKSTGEFADDRSVGIHFDFRENGDTSTVREWKDKKIVYQLDFNSDGSRKKLVQKDGNGKKHGAYILYHKGANLIREHQIYKHGIEASDLIKNFKSGRIAEKYSFKNGEKRIVTKYYDFGSEPVKKSETHYQDGKRNGATLSYHKDGKISMEGTNVNNKKDGQFTWYRPKEILRKIETYTLGTKAGIFEEYYNDGELEKKWFCLDGKKEGEFIAYHRNGEIEEQTTYVKGKRHGHFVYKKDDGTIRREGEYENGMRQGTWMEYDKEVEYINDVEQ